MSLKRLHTLLNITGQMDSKRELISAATNGRTESAKELKPHEMKALLGKLQALAPQAPNDARTRQMKKIYALARNKQWTYWNGAAFKVDTARLDQWCIKYGQYHKPLQQHTNAELTHLLTQLLHL
ncbi:MAG: hypothetical protein AB7G44_03470 [Bacteroidia bacterium]